MSENKKTASTGAASKAETKAKSNADALVKDTPVSKTDTDKAAAEKLAAPITEGGKSASAEITALNQASSTGDAKPEVVEAAQAVFDADKRRQDEQINNANVVNDAKTLIQRRAQEGIPSEAEKAAAERAAERAGEEMVELDFNAHADGLPVPKAKVEAAKEANEAKTAATNAAQAQIAQTKAVVK